MTLNTPYGAVATGNPQTSDAAATILRAGGNAVDAAIAAALTSFVAEPLLASAGGSGMMTVVQGEGSAAVIDFFSQMPGLGSKQINQANQKNPSRERDFRAIEIDFGAATQTFHVGRASAAAPLSFAGLAAASDRFGKLPLADVVVPAAKLARQGALVTPESAWVFSLLWPIIRLSDETTRTYGTADTPPIAGSRHPMGEMADLLETFGRERRSPAAFDEALLEAFGVAAGGSLTREDLEAAEPTITQPRRIHIGDTELFVSPRLGGKLLALIANELAKDSAESKANDASEWLRIAEACRTGTRAKGDPRALGSTTHISVIDGEGNAASVTLTNGEGCGYVVPGTGVQMNNFLGEEDLHPRGFFHHAPGAPLPSMIAPTVAVRTKVVRTNASQKEERGIWALGSGGANRIRSVVAQVLWRAVLEGQSLEEAILAPRLHAEETAAWFEAVDAPTDTYASLANAFDTVTEFPDRAFFFGGVHGVQFQNGTFDAFADPRRGGKAILVK